MCRGACVGPVLRGVLSQQGDRPESPPVKGTADVCLSLCSTGRLPSVGEREGQLRAAENLLLTHQRLLFPPLY